MLSNHNLLEDEVGLNISEKQVVDLLEEILRKLSFDVVIKEYTLTALMKLTPKLRTQIERIKALLQKYQSDVILEVQQRSCEYTKILQYEQVS